MIFSEIVKHVRKELNISQEQLAHKLNVSFSTVNRWETGKTQPLPIIKERFYDYCKEKNIRVDGIAKEDMQ